MHTALHDSCVLCFAMQVDISRTGIVSFMMVAEDEGLTTSQQRVNGDGWQQP